MEARSSIDLTQAEVVTPEPSLAELLSATTHDLSELLRTQVELAKVEIKEEATAGARAGAMFGAAGLLGYLALALFAFAAAWGLSSVLPTGFAFLIVGVLVAAVAAAFFIVGRQKLEAFQAVPRQTVETIQEDVQWAKQQLS
jgi:hypothetical protein